MIKRLSALGCLGMVAVAALIAGMLHAMGLTKYAVFYFKALFLLAASPELDPAIWADAEAAVVSIAPRTDANYRDLARIVLRYTDADGRERVGTFEIYSASRGLGRISKGDRLALEVCRRDPTIIKSDEFGLSDGRKCAEKAQ